MKKQERQKKILPLLGNCLFFEQKHSAGFLCPAILRHIFAAKFRLAAFKIADIIALDQARVHAVARSFVTQNRLRSHRFQRVLQIHKELAQIRRVFCIIHIVGKECNTDLLCRHPRTLSVNEESKQFFSFQSLEHQLFVLRVNLKIAEAIHRKDLFPLANALDIINLGLHVLR